MPMLAGGMSAGLPMSVGNAVTSCVVRRVRVPGTKVAVAIMTRVTRVTVRIAMTVSMATQPTNRHPREAYAAKREGGDIYVH